jgi:hypothetical protein
VGCRVGHNVGHLKKKKQTSAARAKYCAELSAKMRFDRDESRAFVMFASFDVCFVS